MLLSIHVVCGIDLPAVRQLPAAVMTNQWTRSKLLQEIWIMTLKKVFFFIFQAFYAFICCTFTFNHLTNICYSYVNNVFQGGVTLQSNWTSFSSRVISSVNPLNVFTVHFFLFFVTVHCIRALDDPDCWVSTGSSWRSELNKPPYGLTGALVRGVPASALPRWAGWRRGRRSVSSCVQRGSCLTHLVSTQPWFYSYSNTGVNTR